MRAALEHPARDADLRLARIVAVGFAPTARVLGDAAGLGRIGRMLMSVPVRGPFPDVADQVVKAISIRRKRGHRGSALEAILTLVLERKRALPGIGHVATARR